MSAIGVYRVQAVSGVIRARASDLPYPSRMTTRPDSPAGEEPRLRFARVIRQAREERGMTQDDLAERAEVSRPTLQRWENAKTETPEPEKARRVFRALGLDPRLIPVLLGYVTAEEMGLPPEPPRLFSPTVEEAIRILEDPNVPAASKKEWLEFLRFRAGAAEGRAVAYDATVAIEEHPKAG